VRLLGQNKASSFSDLMEKLNIKDSSTLTHHLKKLEGLVDQAEDGKYALTDLGHAAYNILRRGDNFGDVRSCAFWCFICYWFMENWIFRCGLLSRLLGPKTHITRIWVLETVSPLHNVHDLRTNLVTLPSLVEMCCPARKTVSDSVFELLSSRLL